MATGFLGSKEFVVSAVLAGLVLVAGVGVGIAANDVDLLRHPACASRVPSGAPLAAVPTDTGAWDNGGDEVRRVREWQPELGNLSGGTASMCTSVGDIRLEPSTDGGLHVTVDVHAHGPGARRAVLATEVQVAFAAEGGRLNLGVWESRIGESRGWFSNDWAIAHVTLAVPAGLLLALDAESEVGDFQAKAIDLASAQIFSGVGEVVWDRVGVVGTTSISTGVGDVEWTRAVIGGNLDARTSVGDVTLRISEVGNGSWSLSTEVGDVDVRLPAAESVGYSVRGSADVGSVAIDIGDAEHTDHDEDTPGETREARSRGYAEKAVRVVVVAEVEVGDVEVDAA